MTTQVWGRTNSAMSSAMVGVERVGAGASACPRPSPPTPLSAQITVTRSVQSSAVGVTACAWPTQLEALAGNEPSRTTSGIEMWLPSRLTTSLPPPTATLPVGQSAITCLKRDGGDVRRAA